MSPAHHLGAALSAALGDFPPVLQAMHCHMYLKANSER